MIFKIWKQTECLSALEQINTLRTFIYIMELYTLYTQVNYNYAAVWMNYVSIMLKKEASYKIMQPDQN